MPAPTPTALTVPPPPVSHSGNANARRVFVSPLRMTGKSGLPLVLARPRIHIRKYPLYTPRSLVRQPLIVAADYHVQARISKQPPRRIPERHRLALSMPRRHKYHQSLTLARRYQRQLLIKILLIWPSPLPFRKHGSQPFRKVSGISGAAAFLRFSFRFGRARVT